MEDSLLKDSALIRACLAANRDPETRALEEDWDQVQDEIEESWNRNHGIETPRS
ncbi:MAG: hypothetical protein ABI824_01915 [Acidobacteriota bacterium]